MMITFAAITISPKLLVSDCTITIAMEKIAWVIPDGRPRRIISIEYCFFIFRYLGLKSKMSVIRIRRHMQSTAEIACAITVAYATPATPMWNWETNTISNTILMTVATSR